MISKDKQYRTKGGKEVRIYATDCGGDRAVHGAVLVDDVWNCLTWLKNGRRWDDMESDADLIEIKPRIKREMWVNVYRHSTSGDYASKGTADQVACSDRIACVKVIIDCEEGEGL